MTNQQERLGASPPVSSEQHVPNRRGGACAQPLLRFALPALLLAILLALPATATAQIWIDDVPLGETYWYVNYDDITTARIEGAYWLNNRGSIVEATVHGLEGYWGGLYNGTDGSAGYIETANFHDGYSRNGSNDDGYIQTANIYGGNVDNSNGSNGYIKIANVYGGAVYNGADSNRGTRGTIDTANVHGGTVYNAFGHIGTANVYDGAVHNTGGGNVANSDIQTANVYGGTVSNSDWIGTALLDGGHIYNYANGRIDNLVYTSGTYDSPYYSCNVGTLTLAGDSANNTGDWGIVENLQFADNGSGILTISAFADSPFAAYQADSASVSSNITFDFGINAQNIDFTNGNIVLNLIGFVNKGTQFSLFDIFDGAEIFGTLASLTIGEQQFYNVGTNAVFTYSDGTWAVSEPATFVVLGLGLAGLGLARRRRK